ncbi:hypothetical protein CEUSTIGMA_g5950.t1 [Chlamydomonas eustigma]|uniref:RING-CH-type domain-containing protein n=1 Tax=Chlamydomonas eustigma TaxID=1157962 RepID=A0A250X607_9CHLO|nr:hypothetical protein CEUSTIGMA_g5950.t1 [Chlamydomonas eustigma]|eukprot:GAX78511.1 hypothetical protein CEUSTIGMA_g5950.t1 [Chlamydomonas eustigma]
MPITDLTEGPHCWLCLSGVEAGPLNLPCECPTMYSHPVCRGRWQLQQAGKDEECFCRFCKTRLPTWTVPLLGTGSADEMSPKKGNSTGDELMMDSESIGVEIPMMTVVFNGNVARLPCYPGKAGAEEFKLQVKNFFNLSNDAVIDVTFELKVKSAMNEDAGSRVHLKGFETFDAASKVAAVCASRRRLNVQRGYQHMAHGHKDHIHQGHQGHHLRQELKLEHTSLGSAVRLDCNPPAGRNILDRESQVNATPYLPSCALPPSSGRVDERLARNKHLWSKLTMNCHKDINAVDTSQQHPSNRFRNIISLHQGGPDYEPPTEVHEFRSGSLLPSVHVPIKTTGSLLPSVHVPIKTTGSLLPSVHVPIKTTGSRRGPSFMVARSSQLTSSHPAGSSFGSRSTNLTSISEPARESHSYCLEAEHYKHYREGAPVGRSAVCGADRSSSSTSVSMACPSPAYNGQWREAIGITADSDGIRSLTPSIEAEDNQIGCDQNREHDMMVASGTASNTILSVLPGVRGRLQEEVMCGAASSERSTAFSSAASCYPGSYAAGYTTNLISLWGGAICRRLRGVLHCEGSGPDRVCCDEQRACC